MASARKLNPDFLTPPLFLLTLRAVPAFAQFSSGIEGTARDTSGAVLAGAQVIITDTRLGVSKDTTTNDGGYFRIDSIAASTYTVEVRMTGFEILAAGRVSRCRSARCARWRRRSRWVRRRRTLKFQRPKPRSTWSPRPPAL